MRRADRLHEVLLGSTAVAAFFQVWLLWCAGPYWATPVLGAIAHVVSARELELLVLGDRSSGARERPIVARVPIDDRNRAALTAALFDGWIEAEWQLMCFAPHHRVRAVGPAGVAELDVCISCAGIAVAGQSGADAFDPRAFEALLNRLGLPWRAGELTSDRAGRSAAALPLAL